MTAPLDIIEDSAQQTNILSTIGLSMDYDRIQGSPLNPNELKGAMDEMADRPIEMYEDQNNANAASQKGYSLFPNIESIAQFKHHLNMTLCKLRDPLTVPQAKQELHELMTEHVINTDRMNTFLAALSGLNNNISTQGGSGGTSQLITSEKNRRKEMIKVYGEAAEIFEESLITFVPKIVQYFQKILKETEQLYHVPVAQSLGKLIFCVVSKIEHEDDKLDQTKQILRAFYQNIQVPNQTLQIGSALCIRQVIQSTEPELVIRLAISTMKQLTDSIKSKYCKSQKFLIECLEELISVKEQNSLDKVPVALQEDKVDQRHLMDMLVPCLLTQGSNLEATARKQAIKCLAVVADRIQNKEQLLTFKDDIMNLLQETKCDKAKPVRDATNEALVIYRQIDAMFKPHQDIKASPYQAKDVLNTHNPHKELTLGSPDSQIPINFNKSSKEETGNVLGSKPNSFINTETRGEGNLLTNMRNNDSNTQLLNNLSSKILSPPAYGELNEVNSQTFSGGTRGKDQIQEQVVNHKLTSLDLQKMIQLTKNVYGQSESMTLANDQQEQSSSVRTVIRQNESGEVSHKANELPPRHRVSASKNSSSTLLNKIPQFENGSKTHKPYFRTNSSQQRFSHLKIHLDGESQGNRTDRDKQNNRPSTTRNSGGRPNGRGSQKDSGAAQIQSGKKASKMQRSASYNNYMTQQHELRQRQNAITPKLTMATKKKLEMRQQALKQHPHSVINKTVPQRNSRIDWNEQVEKNRQSIFQGPRNTEFFSNQNNNVPNNDVEIFVAEKRQTNSVPELPDHVGGTNAQQSARSPTSRGSPRRNRQDRLNGSSERQRLSHAENDNLQHERVSTQLNSNHRVNHQGEGQTHILLGGYAQQTESGRESAGQRHVEKKVEELDVSNDNNQFMSNFGRVYHVKNLQTKHKSLEQDDTQQIEQNFVIERRHWNQNKNGTNFTQKTGVGIDYGALKEQSSGHGPLKDSDSTQIRGTIESQKIEMEQPLSIEKINENVNAGRESKIVCDDEYQNFGGSTLQMADLKTGQESYVDRQFEKLKQQEQQHAELPVHSTGSSANQFQVKDDRQVHVVPPPQDPKNHLKDVIVLRQMKTDQSVKQQTEAQNQSGLNNMMHISSNLVQHARIGSGDGRIAGDNSFSLNSDINILHNLTQQDFRNSNERGESPPHNNFIQLRQAQMDFNNLQKQQRMAHINSSLTQTNNSIKNQVIDDFSISCFRQSQCTTGMDNGVGTSAIEHRKMLSGVPLQKEINEVTGQHSRQVVQKQESQEQNVMNLPTTNESGQKNAENVEVPSSKMFNDNAMSDQNTYSHSYAQSNQPTPRYPEPSAKKGAIPLNSYQQINSVIYNNEAGTAHNTQRKSHSSRDIGSTIHDIDLKADNFVAQIMSEVQVLREENKYLKDRLLRLEDLFSRKQNENEVRIKALETLFLENRVPSQIQSIDPPDDPDISINKRLNTGAFPHDDLKQIARASHLTNNFSSHRRMSTLDEKNNSDIVFKTATQDYLNGGIDLANKKPNAKQHQSNSSSMHQLNNNDSTLSTRRAKEKQADANQLVDLALHTHNVSFLYQLMENQQKFQEINADNINRLLQFTFQKLTLQKGRHRLSSARRESGNNSSRQLVENKNDLRASKRDMATPSPGGRSSSRSFVVDHGLVDSLLLLTMKIIDIHMPLGSIDLNSTVFLDLIQLFIDLLKDDSILTSLQKIKLQQIYEKIEKQF